MFEIVRAGNVVVKVFWALNRDCISTVRSFVVTEVCLVVAVAVVVTRHTKIVLKGVPKVKSVMVWYPTQSCINMNFVMFDAVLTNPQLDLYSQTNLAIQNGSGYPDSDRLLTVVSFFSLKIGRSLL